jgi:hypothetical protein
VGDQRGAKPFAFRKVDFVAEAEIAAREAQIAELVAPAT